MTRLKKGKKADSFYRGIHRDILFNCLSMESIRLGGPAHGLVTKTVHKTLPGGGGGPGGGWVGVVWGPGVVRGGGGSRGG